MKIFATADLHGNRVAMDCLRSLVSRVDLILICGDVGGRESIPPEREACNLKEMALAGLSAGQRKDVEYLDKVLEGIDVEGFYILGNDDWFDWQSPHLLTEPIVRGGLTFIPFDFVNLTPFNTNREANENKLAYELSKHQVDENTIMVAHTPPFGAGDTLYDGKHCGSKSVRDWIKFYQPKMWLCGHIHEDFGKKRMDKCQVLNCTTYPNKKDGLRGWLIDTEKGTVEMEAL